MNKFYVGLGIFAALVGIFFILTLIYNKPAPAQDIKSKIIVGENKYFVEIADTLQLKAKGLSGRESLSLNTGMYFKFDRSGIYPFWMFGMKFSIDIIWIREGQVIGFVESAKIGGGPMPAIYYPPGEIDAVLEVVAGTVAKDGIEIGQSIKIEQI